jgi:pilus assembly protein Flp/PilA
MKKINNILWNLRIVKDTKGQDLIEYALMAGFVAVAAGAIMPNVATSISTIFDKISTSLAAAAGQGGAS